MKVFVTMVLLLNVCCYGKTENENLKTDNDSSVLSTDCQGLKEILAKPKKYGVVIGNRTGAVLAAYEITGGIQISYQMDSSSETLYALCSDMIHGKNDKEVVSLKFNPNGTAHGKNKKDEDVFILIGEKSTDNEVISRTRNKGQNFNSVSMNMVRNNQLPGHDAPTWYYHEEENYVQISFVFPVGFVHPSYGPQKHVRIFVFRKQNGKWVGVEDNSSVGH